MANDVYNLYLKYLNESMSYRLDLGRVAYRKTEEALKTRYDSWNAFNGVINLSVMCLCGDGNLSYNDYEIFKSISNCTPTYQELCATASHLDYKLIVSKIRSCGQNVVSQALYLCAVIFACKGSYGVDEQALVNALSR